MSDDPVDAVLGVGVFARPAPEPEADDTRLSTGAFARRSRLSMKALRLYDRQGLLRPAHVDPGSGYRWYRESQLATARLIALLRRLDMPLAEVAQVVSAAGGTAAAEALAVYWEAAERRFASQRELAAHLRLRLQGEGRRFDRFEVHERDVAEQVVLTEQRHVLVDELPDWMGRTMGRLVRTAQRYGGLTGPTFAVYHGEVNRDSDGPVEVCVPVGMAPGADGPAARVEPAHREAYVRLRRAQVEYPQILSAYDAVTQWLSGRGLDATASPREVYFTDFAAAGPADEVCDVAFPIG